MISLGLIPMRIVVRTLLPLFLVAGFSENTFAQSQSVEDFYRGKTLSVVVGLAPGGGIDIIARLFSRILAKHIDGAPTVIVRNMPGAAGATAMNYMVQRAPKDGTTLIYDSWTPLEQVIKARHVTYDYTKMELVGALRSGPRFFWYSRSSSASSSRSRARSSSPDRSSNPSSGVSPRTL